VDEPQTAAAEMGTHFGDVLAAAVAALGWDGVSSASGRNR
jgi:hypothetical protein